MSMHTTLIQTRLPVRKITINAALLMGRWKTLNEYKQGRKVLKNMLDFARGKVFGHAIQHAERL